MINMRNNHYMSYSIKNFKQNFQVQYIDKMTFENNPTQFVHNYYQTDNNKYTSMGVITTVIHVKLNQGRFDIIEGLVVNITVRALVYCPVIGSIIPVVIKQERPEFIGCVLTDDIKSAVHLIEQPPPINDEIVYPLLIKYVNIISWQCQIMDKLIIIGKLVDM